MSDPIDANSPDEEPKKRNGLHLSIRNSFFAGVVVALPIAVTIWLITWFVGFVDKNVKTAYSGRTDSRFY